MTSSDDPVLRNARREAIIILAAWLTVLVYCCTYCFLFGYIREGQDLGPEDIRPILGIPSWFFWGVVVPWIVCGLFTIVFAGFFMTDDDLGADHAPELEAEIREGGHHDG